MTATLPAGSASGAEPQPLRSPRDGVPPVVVDAVGLADVVARFAAGTGPVAVDAERASGYRYSQRAYLVQLRRTGAGTALIDPIACPDLSALGAALGDAEWVLHAASQDLACLAEVGMVPTRLFDTELGGRLAGYPRVGLGALVESLLGLQLEKGHSAADWSTRPLPRDWLVYAALDVEVLVELRDLIEAELDRQGKLAWARAEFAHLLAAPPPGPRVDPWRRTSGIHRLRSRRQLAGVRALWEARDELARRRDVAPGRVLPDAAIVTAVTAGPATPEELRALPGFGGRGTRRHLDLWFGALAAAAALPDEELPQSAPPPGGPPPPGRWAERDPVAARRLALVRAAVAEVAAEHDLPPENLIAPDAVRRLAWQPPARGDAASVRTALGAGGARAWQLDLVTGPVADALRAAAAEPPADTAAEPPADTAAEPLAGTAAEPPADTAAEPLADTAAEPPR